MANLQSISPVMATTDRLDFHAKTNLVLATVLLLQRRTTYYFCRSYRHSSCWQLRLYILNQTRLSALHIGVLLRAPLAAKGLLIVEIFGAIAGFSRGEPLLLHDPSRRLLRLPSDLLNGLPITNYFPAGLWLFFVYGAGLSLEIYGLWRLKRWAWPLGILLGVIWIC